MARFAGDFSPDLPTPVGNNETGERYAQGITETILSFWALLRPYLRR